MNANDDSPATICRRCGKPLEPDDRYCRHCGAAARPATAWYYHPLAVLAMLFLVVGPLALPLLWKSPRFSLALKIILSVVNVAYFALIAWGSERIYFYLIQQATGITL